MLCYRCSHEMQKIPVDGSLIDYCDVCRSVWIDSGEAEKILSDRGSSISQLVAEARLEVINERITGSTKGLCPRCDGPKLDHFVSDGLNLDRCSKCGGLFFDIGEFEKFMDQRKPFLDKFCDWVAKLFTQPHKHVRH
jgi:Zn-finger nucleic acid-binding protein